MDVCAKDIKSLCLFNVLYTKILLLALYFLQRTAPLFLTHHWSVRKTRCISRTIQNSFTVRKKGSRLNLQILHQAVKKSGKQDFSAGFSDGKRK